KKWFHSRKDRGTPWTPVTDGPAMQNRLIALGTAQLEKMRASSGGLRVKVGFGAGNMGEGLYDDGRFVWTQGLKKGFGFTATESAQDALEEGQYAYNSHFWTWCVSRPQVINGRLGDGVPFRVEIEKGQWYVKNGEKKSKIDSTVIEKWLGRNCTVKIDFFKDRASFTGLLKRLAEISNAAEWSISFAASTQDKSKDTMAGTIEYVKKGKFWLINNEMAIYSRQLDEALTELSQSVQLSN
ncbi:MAG: hypothetical protein AABZ31_06875, partial [Bdellovibrionota bacterium]